MCRIAVLTWTVMLLSSMLLVLPKAHALDPADPAADPGGAPHVEAAAAPHDGQESHGGGDAHDGGPHGDGDPKDGDHKDGAGCHEGGGAGGASCPEGAGCACGCDPDRITLHAAGQCLSPTAEIQLWGTLYDQDENAQADVTGYGDPEDDPGVKLKRIELGFEGHSEGGKVRYELVLGTSSPYDGFAPSDTDAGIKYANLTYAPVDWFDVKGGRMTVPFGRDALMSNRQLTFTEHGFVAEEIAPATTLGAEVGLHKWGLKLRAGVFNSGGSLFGDDSGGKDFAGRLEWSHGKADSYRTWGDDKAFGIGIGASGFYDIGIATTSSGVGADAMVRFAGASLLVDAALEQLEPTETTVTEPAVLATTTRQALTAQVSYAVWKLEPAVRFTGFADNSVGSYGQLLGGITLHGWKDRARFGAGYVHRFEFGDTTAVDNDTARLWAQVAI